ncbi:hypothetical protein SAMN04488065_1086 [Haloplanus vescus]|uniref:Uncharacterized protein n=1 Tax=Haloplanus vescus TaxID=555874 RepID=A0A1H3WTS0_9EURY|nr:hypothetical protein [Haloplanus vescus]SDZ89772.1 hypothetical protein SAMN04488065_1086 [Haloplanus vescus]
MVTTRWRRRRRVVLATLLWLVTGTGVATAHSGGLGGSARDPIAVPTWLFLLTGGGVVGVSFLLASFVTDRNLVDAIHDWGRPLPTPGRLVRLVARVGALALFVAVLVTGYLGPSTGVRSLTVLVVWVGWWGGYVASTYLLGNTWSTLNPVRMLVDPLPSLERAYPDRLGAWPSVAGLLLLVWVEVTTPLADDPRLLATVLVAYTLVTVGGAVVFGPDQWFDRVDPISRALRLYGRLAPLHVADGRLRLRLPGADLPDTVLDGRDDVAFVVTILFVTTYDGFVATGPWAGVARTVVGAGVPSTALYLGAYLVGAALFYLAYRASARLGRHRADTYLTTTYLARRFAPALLPIAAGYHLAHNLGTVLTLGPTLAAVATAPLSPPASPPQLAGLPAWFGGLELACVLVGHLVAVWVAHATAYDVFPSRLQAVRSQYGVTAVMVVYTMLSLWIVAEPYVAPPFIAT